MDELLNDSLMTPDEIARYLRVSKSMMYKLVAGSAIPHIHVGRILRFRKSEVDRWMTEDRPARKSRGTGNGNETVVAQGTSA